MPITDDTVLLKTSGILKPGDSKTVQTFAFDVPEGAEALSVVFEWTPGTCDDAERNRRELERAMGEWNGPSVLDDQGDRWQQDDVRRAVKRLPNLLNCVLVQPDGRWRGRTDRGKATRDRPLHVDALAPGPGFLAGALEPGAWSVDMEVHAIVSESCEFFLEVTTAPAQPVPDDDAGEVADLGGPGWHRGELHTHTRHSDGSHTVQELGRRAKALGLDFVALTDHNTTSGARELDRAAVPGILGVELTTFRGHHVVLGLDEMVPWHEDGRVLGINDVVSRVKDKGALFTLTHPFNLGDPICTGCRWMTPELDLSTVDLVEIWHRRWTGDSADNPAARDLWDQLWRDGHRPAAVAVRDWHNGQHEAPLPGPLPCTVVQAESRRAEHLLDGLRGGRAYITRGPTLDFALVDGDATLGIGDRATASGGRVTARATFEGAPAGAQLTLLKCGEPVAETRIDGDGEGPQLVTLTCDGGAGWYRVELHGVDERGDDGPFVISNHVELT
jgi:hypothetical protein